MMYSQSDHIFKAVASCVRKTKFYSRPRHSFVAHICTVEVELRGKGWRVMASQLNPQSLMSLSVAGWWCREKLAVAQWATSVALLKVVDNLSLKQW